jgi:hypothetical protein
VAFIPTTQSASERERAAASSRSISSPGRRASKASSIAFLVIELSHSRLTGLSVPEVSYRYAKISSPSRPASQALTISSISSLRISLWTAESCFFALSSFGTSLNSSGRIGRSAKRHFLSLGS